MASGVRKRRGVCARRPSASLGLAPQRSRNPRHAAPVDILDGRKTTFLRFIPASRPARRMGAQAPLSLETEQGHRSLTLLHP